MMRKKQRLDRDLAGHRRPAEHRRHGAGRAADHDVLRRRRLEDHGVDDGVADERGQREPHGERVHEVDQQPKPGAAEAAGEHQGLRRRQLALRQGPPARALITASIFCSTRQFTAAAAPPQEDAGRGREQRGRRNHAGCGEEHADHRGEHDERHHARLGQRDEGAQALGEARKANLCIHRGGRKPRKAKSLARRARPAAPPRRRYAGRGQRERHAERDVGDPE